MSKKLFKPDERKQADLISRLTWCNPFCPERFELERTLVGDAFRVPEGDDIAQRLTSNMDALMAMSEKLLNASRERVAKDAEQLDYDDLKRYRDVVFFFTYHRVFEGLRELVHACEERGVSESQRVTAYRKLLDDLRHYMPGPAAVAMPFGPHHLFACYFQIYRAYHHIFHYIIGQSEPVCRLRARVWESIFTCDMERYQRSLYNRLGDVTTLVTGPSGSGKELVARAVGLSRFIPFDEKSQRFTELYTQCFHPVNLSALSPTLIESELFGHRRGAFTGALEDRVGYFEGSGEHGTVFLDEIGEASQDIQVKLLRVLQTRQFQRLGETSLRTFSGKIVAATNRNLTHEMEKGQFREDLYYRLCADRLETPSLKDILAASPADLSKLVGHIARGLAGLDEAPALTDEAIAVIEEKLGEGYQWPGNFRELEQCVRNILVHGDYTPPGGGIKEADALPARMDLTLNELNQRYVTAIYEAAGKNFEEAARRLGIDRRTVKKYVEVS